MRLSVGCYLRTLINKQFAAQTISAPIVRMDRFSILTRKEREEKQTNNKRLSVKKRTKSKVTSEDGVDCHLNRQTAGVCTLSVTVAVKRVNTFSLRNHFELFTRGREEIEPVFSHAVFRRAGENRIADHGAQWLI